MPTLGNVHGAPGTGKTFWLTQKFIQEVKKRGRDRVGAITYTRAAAGEFSFRAGQALAIRDPRSSLPYVGTIHSMCYALLGRPPMLENKDYIAFCNDSGIEPPRSSRRDDVALDLGDEDTSETEEGSILRRVIAESRHRHISVEEAASGHSGYTPKRFTLLAEKYVTWKEREGLLDFEDLLVQGMRKQLPVDVLFVDEAQDNSSLLFSVINRWADKTELTICAGDPWQAIYIFGGADPSLFRDRPGKWMSLKLSHRLRPDAAEYSKTLLRDGGWSDPMFDAWQGDNQALPEANGTTLYLARTNRMLVPIREQLIRQGEPFGEYNRMAPLRTVSADAYRVLSSLIEGQTVGWGDFRAAASYTRRFMPASIKPRRSVPNKAPLSLVTAHDGEMWLGPLRDARERLPNYDYFREVEKNYGMRGLVLRPKTMISTIHAAKGREADHIKLVANWGWLPSRALRDDQGRKRESLVAYVAATRHRETFELIEGGYGKRFPWS